MSEISFLEAGRVALVEEMRRDPMVWALGEDLAQGGSLGLYKGLAEEFGNARVVDTPISESTIMGAGLGASLVGTRPVVEMRISDFALCATDELVNQVAKIRYMFGGQVRAPMVIRMPYGVRANAAAQHSQSLESWYVHIPGLVVVTPATPADNKGLLKAAIRCDDPVVYMEAKEQLGDIEDVPDEDFVVPIGAARIAREGTDATIVAWSRMVSIAREVADRVAESDGWSIEVVDLRTLWPWDKEAVFASVAKTGRALVAQEAVAVCGLASEIAATIAEEMTPALKAPIARIGAPRIPVPYAPPLEEVYRVTPDKLAARLRRLMNGAN